jgi:hypothetical protein
VSVTIDEITIGDPPEAWRDAGFLVDDDGVATVGHVRLRFIGRERGKRILGWTLRDLPAAWPGDLDGLPTEASERAMPEPGAHPIGARLIDHVVVLSPDEARTIRTLEAVGLEPRRQRETDTYGMPMRQTFFRLGEVVLELIATPEPSGDGPCAFFGLALTVDDLDATSALLGDGLGRVKEAVQPGRRIATVRHKDLGLSVALALMSPDPAATSAQR